MRRPSPYPARRRRLTAVLAGSAVVAMSAVVGVPAAYAAPPSLPGVAASPPGPPDTTDGARAGVLDQLPRYAPGRYIVTLADAPVAAYRGGVPGIEPTRPESGDSVDVDSPSAQALTERLQVQQEVVAAQVGVTPLQTYTVALNGFVAELSGEQAETLRESPDVISVAPDRLVSVDQSATPVPAQAPAADPNQDPTQFLGLRGSNGVWATLGGPARAGEGTVVGVIDTGIWPESPSFAAPALRNAPSPQRPLQAYRQGENIVMQKADGSTFTGACEAGEQFTAAHCNTKIVSARAFGEAWLGQAGEGDIAEFRSPRDHHGHGTHVASTAAGRANVAARSTGRELGRVSGVAPGAAIASYKALWGEGVGFTSDIVAAVDQAVADGVDVINYSVGSLFESAADDPVQLAFLSAASAGIFVAASAGNSDEFSIDNTSPWVTTVAASTVAIRPGSVRLGQGPTLLGASSTVSTQVGPAPVRNASAVARTDAPPADAALCFPGTLDPALVAGTVVVCDRGVIARPAKAAEVAAAGGIGMVLVNTSTLDTSADLTAVPTVHLDVVHERAVKDHAATAGATVTLLPGSQGAALPPYPQVAPFSSRGPSVTQRGDLLKPDLAAPGVSVLAAVAPPGNEGNDYSFNSGTSMAAPHVAGLAALSTARHPDWSPMAIKSALMTTTGPTVDAAGRPLVDPFADGAGHVTPRRMLDPGLVYDAGDEDWLAHLEGLGVSTGTGVAARPAWDLNGPSLASGRLVGARTFTREITALTPGIYRATASVPGMNVRVSPSIVNFTQPGQTRRFTVTMTRTTAPSDAPAFGHLTWQGAGRTVRSPIAVSPRAVDLPDSVYVDGDQGSVSIPAVTGTPGLSVGATPLVQGNAQNMILPTYGQAPDLSDIDIHRFVVTDRTVAVRAWARSADPNAGLTGLLATGDLGDDGGQIVAFPDRDGTNALDYILTDLPPGEYFMLTLNYLDTPTEVRTQVDVVESGATGIAPLTVTPTEVPGRAGTPFSIQARWPTVPSPGGSTGYVSIGDMGTVIAVD